MKNTIVHLGILLFAFAINANATTASAILQKAPALFAATENCHDLFISKSSAHDEENIMNPESVISRKVTRSIEDIIAENNKIIENTLPNATAFLYIEKPIEDVIIQNNQIIEDSADMQVKPLTIEKTMQDTIAEDNQIIESNIQNEVRPLGLASE